MKPLTVLLFFLLLTVSSRIAGAYVSPVGHVPGWDFNDYGVSAWHALSQGKTSVIFGYGTVLLAAVGLRYPSIVAASLIGLCVLLFLFVKEKNTRQLAILGFAIFLLGVPITKAIEAGNPDLFLSVLFGIILLALRKNISSRSVTRSILLGLLLGFFLNVKGFLLLFVVAALAMTQPDVPLLISFCLSFMGFALWPWLYGVKSGLFDVFIFAFQGSQAESQTLFTQIHYGNNAILPYVSNILQTFRAPRIVIYLGSAILATCIFIKPFIDEKIRISAGLIRRSRPLFSFTLLIFTLCYIMMLTLTAWSYDYRILYVLPLLFCFLDEAHDRHTTQLLYLSIIFLLTKSLFIPKDRIMTAFLYLHFYFLLRASVSLLYNGIHERYHHDS